MRFQIRQRRSLLVVLVLIGLTMFFRPQLVGFLDWLSGFVLERVNGVENVVLTIASIRTLEEDSRRLEEENIRLKSLILETERYRAENEALRTELEMLTERQWRDQSVTGFVVARSPSRFLQTIRINLGLDDGLSEGAPVTSQGFLVGRVEAVEATSATVELITSSRSRIPVVLPELKADGLLQGGLSGLTVEEVLLETDVRAGAAVVTSNLGEIVPSGLPVGTIVRELTAETNLSKSILIESPINFHDLSVVSVLTQPVRY